MCGISNWRNGLTLSGEDLSGLTHEERKLESSHLFSSFWNICYSYSKILSLAVNTGILVTYISPLYEVGKFYP